MATRSLFCVRLGSFESLVPSEHRPATVPHLIGHHVEEVAVDAAVDPLGRRHRAAELLLARHHSSTFAHEPPAQLFSQRRHPHVLREARTSTTGGKGPGPAGLPGPQPVRLLLSALTGAQLVFCPCPACLGSAAASGAARRGRAAGKWPSSPCPQIRREEASICPSGPSPQCDRTGRARRVIQI